MKFILTCILSVLAFSLVQGETVEIVSCMYTEEILSERCFKKIKNEFDVRIVDQKFRNTAITTKYKNIKKYLVFNGHEKLADLKNCPPEKMVLFMMEPMVLNYQNCQAYSRVYTWDDDVVDNKKFFKFYFPDLMPMIDPLPSFEEKKLCTMVVRNWHAKHRGPIVEFFDKKPKGEFEFYGSPYSKLAYNKQYRGRILGLNCGKEKISVLKNYRFCICFENSTNLKGYVSEKIFACFAAGSVPIYWGATNVEEYIPKDCFIDYRDFTDNEEMYRFIKEMPKHVYEGYIQRIKVFLSSEEAQLFSPDNFAQTLYEAAT